MNLTSSLSIIICFCFEVISGNCRDIWCYMKTNSSISSPNILRWDSSTGDPFTLTCSRTHGRIPEACANDQRKKEACTKICGSAFECQESLYLTGTGNFKEEICKQFNWMAPEKTCCVKHNLYTEGKIDILPDSLCENDPGTGCSHRCSLENVKLRCKSECEYDNNDDTYFMWKQ